MKNQTQTETPASAEFRAALQAWSALEEQELTTRDYTAWCDENGPARLAAAARRLSAARKAWNREQARVTVVVETPANAPANAPAQPEIEAAIAADANTAPQTAGDPNSDLTAIIAADDADAADEAAMRATYAPAGDPNSDLTAIVAADEAETVYVRDWLTDTPQSNGEAFVKTNRPDGLRWVADRIRNGGIAIGRYNNVGYGPELPEGDWRPVQVASLRWYAVDDE